MRFQHLRCFTATVALALIGSSCTADSTLPSSEKPVSTLPPKSAPDSVLTPPLPRGVLVLVGDTIPNVGALTRYHAELRDSTGAAVPDQSIWSLTSANPAALEVAPFGFGDWTVLPRRAAPTELVVTSTTAKYGVVRTSLLVRPADLRAVQYIPLGQEITGTIINGVSEKRYVLRHEAGQSVDFAVTRADLRSPSLSLAAVYRGGVGIYGPVTVGAEQELEPAIPVGCLRGGCSFGSGTFTLLARASAPILAHSIEYTGMGNAGFVRAGSTAPHATVWVANLGVGTSDLSVSTDDAFLRPSTSHLSTQGPAVSSSSGAPGAVSAQMTIDATGLAPGRHTTSVRLRWSTPVWIASPYTLTPLNTTEIVLPMEVNVFDAGIEVIRNQYFDALAVTPRGELYGAAARIIYSVNPVSGVATKVAEAQEDIRTLVASPDGSVYVGFLGPVIQQLLPDGRLVPYLGSFAGAAGSSSLTFLADGTPIIANAGRLYLRQPNGGLTILASAGPEIFEPVRFNPADGGLYYARDGSLKRFDMQTRLEENRGPAARFRLSAVDARGRMIGFTTGSGDVVFLDDHGHELTRLVPPGSSSTVATLGNTIYGSGPPYDGRPDFLWKHTLP